MSTFFLNEQGYSFFFRIENKGYMTYSYMTALLICLVIPVVSQFIVRIFFFTYSFILGEMG